MNPSARAFVFIVFAAFGTCDDKRSLRGVHLDMTLPELNHIFAVGSHDQVPQYEIVYIRVNGQNEQRDVKRGSAQPDHPPTLSYDFRAFGQTIKLDLKQNTMLMSKNMSSVHVTASGEQELGASSSNCHYVSAPLSNVVAGISRCPTAHAKHGLSGLIVTPQKPIEIVPVPTRLRNDTDPTSVPHIVKVPDFNKTQSFGQDWKDDSNASAVVAEDDDMGPVMSKRAVAKLTIELAVFVEPAAYNKYLPYLGSVQALHDFVLGYINQVQAMYLMKSLQKPVYISVVHLELQKTLPANSGLSEADGLKLLKNFNKYEGKVKSDMSLLLSGNDFWSLNPGSKVKSTVAMGYAALGGVCKAGYKGVISEIAVTNHLGGYYPSAGWTSAYVTAHEIGHNLGMSHDALNNKCAKDGFIMSPSRGTTGETTWSTCSAAVVATLYQGGKKSCLEKITGSSPPKLNHMKYKGEPGQSWDGHAQCQTLLRNKESWMDPKQKISDICNKMQCKTVGQAGYYSSGPAIAGTYCGGNNWCKNGVCVPASRKLNVVKPGWGPYKADACQSGCLQKAKGTITEIRLCNKPKPMNVVQWCEGSSRRSKICDDTKLCQGSRQSTTQYIIKKCTEFRKHEQSIQPNGQQLPHSVQRSSFYACAVACKLKTGSWFLPMLAMSNIPGLSAFLPDGTWCHNDGSQNYYCQNHECLPESSRSGKSLPIDSGDDILSRIPINQVLQNDKLKSLLEFESDENGEPILKVKELPQDVLDDPLAEGPAVDDTLDIPAR